MEIKIIKLLAPLVALGSFATAAAAQSSVAPPTSMTFYGLVDLSVQHLRSGDLSPMAGASLTRLMDGTQYGPGSRWGIRVTEELGGGVKARVVLESGFTADTGALAQGGRLFGRQGFIALSSPTAGELRLGRQYILHDEVLPFYSAVGGASVVNPGGIYTLPSGTHPVFIDAPRIDNAFHYLSPTFNGFQLQGMVAPGESIQDLYKGLKVSYSNGPFVAAGAYELGKALKAPASGDLNVNKIFTAGANYDFGPVKLFGGFQRGKNLTVGVGTQMGTLALPGSTGGDATESKAYTVGISKQFGPAELMANYARARYSNASGAEGTIGRAGISATYALSKRTSIYGAFAIATGNLKDYTNEKQIYQLGLRQLF